MSGLLGLILIVGLLAFLGAGSLVLITVKYYWGERGTPPVTGEKRRLMRQEELRMRASQIEKSKSNPIVTRRPSFWDNSKAFR